MPGRPGPPNPPGPKPPGPRAACTAADDNQVVFQINAVHAGLSLFQNMLSADTTVSKTAVETNEQILRCLSDKMRGKQVENAQMACQTLSRGRSRCR